MMAMGVDRFVVTLVDAKQGNQEERRWRKEEVLNSMAWLKRMNARGYDVWIRPDGEHGLVLLERVNKKDLQTLREQVFTPAMVVETRSEQYQAWVKLSEYALDAALRRRAAEVLMQGLGRSGANAISRIDGRLAGFTNQKIQLTAGRHPFVLGTKCKGRVAPAAPAYLAKLVQERTKDHAHQRQQKRTKSHGLAR